jgi:NAD(P)-dependent dehydrogenase (short-subunit alcohol dehydrogenase family)
MSRLEGRVAIVTGAGSGIGLACAKRYVDEGAIVFGMDVVETDAWNELEKQAPSVGFATTDVRDEGAVNAAVASVVETYGRIDILLTAAGVAGGGPVHLLSLEDWQRVQDINLTGTFLCCKAVLPTMIEQRSGNLITIASVEGLEAAEGGSTYNASKGGVVLLTKNMAIDYARQGIRVNCICPGFIDTPLLQDVFGNPEMKIIQDRVKDAHMLGRLGKPVEIANAALFLACEESSFVTGHSLVVDGGFTAGHRFGIGKMLGFE